MINEAHGTGGIFTVADILARSSNVGAVKIGLRLGAAALRLVGATGSASAQSTDLPLPGESRGHRAAA